MTDISLDCKGLPCPQPVLRCKEAVEKDGPAQLVVIVDNEPAKENVSRFLTMQGYAVRAEQSGPDFIVTGLRENGAECEECAVMTEAELKDVDKDKILVFVPTDVIGSGDDTLGGNLMYNFMVTLKELGDELWRIILVKYPEAAAWRNSRSLKKTACPFWSAAPAWSFSV